MTLVELMTRMGDLLRAERIPYFVFGAVGMDVWAGPRATSDLDLVICIGRRAIPEFADKLRGMGFRVTKDMERKLGEGRIVKLKIGVTELDLKLCTTEHDRAALERAREVEIGPARLCVATPEDIVLYKLQSWRTQDKADVERIKGEVEDLDGAYIEGWLDRIQADTGYPVRERWASVS